MPGTPSIHEPAIATERAAMCRLYLELTHAIHDSIYPDGDGELDPGLVVVCATVLLGHAEGRAMNIADVAATTKLARSTVERKLAILVRRGVAVANRKRYYLEPERAANVPMLARFIDVLSRAFVVLGPYLMKSRDEAPARKK